MAKFFSLFWGFVAIACVLFWNEIGHHVRFNQDISICVAGSGMVINYIIGELGDIKSTLTELKHDN